MENKCPGASLYATYAGTVIGFAVSMTLGATALIGGIVRFFNVSMAIPVIGGLVDTAVIATVAGAVSMYAMNKVAHSADAAQLASSDFYKKVNSVAKFMAKLLAIFGVAVAAAALLEMLLRASLIKYNWDDYLLGTFLPALALAAGAYASGIMIDKFEKAQLKPSLLPTVGVAIAGVALILSIISVAVTSNIDITSTYRSSIQYQQFNGGTGGYDY